LRISVLVCARDEAGRLDDCLRRLAAFDEIVLVADRCIDATAEIGRRYGATVVEGVFPLEGQRKEAGLTACTGEWVFELDADEHVDAALAAEIRRTADADEADWFKVPVDNYVGDRLVRWGWGGCFGTTLAVRLYRRGVKAWKPDRVHPGLLMSGAYGGALASPIRHYVDDDIGDMLDRLNRYTALRAADLADRGEPGELWDNVFRGFRRFWKCYVRRKGRREGGMGFLIALMAGLYPVLSHLRAKELLERRAPQIAASPARRAAAEVG
jgi:glycosyltransferase involved in cell wall biosynthesis